MDEEGSPGTTEQLLPKQAREGKVRIEEWEEGVCEQTEPLSPSCERAFLCYLGWVLLFPSLPAGSGCCSQPELEREDLTQAAELLVLALELFSFGPCCDSQTGTHQSVN